MMSPLHEQSSMLLDSGQRYCYSMLTFYAARSFRRLPLVMGCVRPSTDYSIALWVDSFSELSQRVPAPLHCLTRRLRGIRLNIDNLLPTLASACENPTLESLNLSTLSR